MKWNYLMLEIYCNYSDEKFENVPCCKTNPGTVDVDCLNVGQSICEYCGFKKMQSAVALSNIEGEVIQTKCFSDDNEMNEKMWEMKQLEWCEKWVEKLKED